MLHQIFIIFFSFIPFVNMQNEQKQPDVQIMKPATQTKSVTEQQIAKLRQQMNAVVRNKKLVRQQQTAIIDIVL